MKRFTVKTLDGVEWTAKDLQGIKKLVGDRVFIPNTANAEKFDFNKYYHDVVLARKDMPKPRTVLNNMTRQPKTDLNKLMRKVIK